MNTFTCIRLTVAGVGNSVWINVNKIISIVELSDNTTFVNCEAAYCCRVKESAKEILDLIADILYEPNSEENKR